MNKRIFVQKGVAELEALYSDKKGDARFLDTLIDELGYRKTQRAIKLKSRAIEHRTSTSSKVAPKAAPKIITERKRSRVNPEPPMVKKKASPVDPFTPPKIKISAPTEVTNDTAQIIRAWTAMEVLSPANFNKPEDLAGGKKWDIEALADGQLPWETGNQKGKKDYRVYYQVILGSIKLEEAVGSLVHVYTDARIDRPQARGNAVLASIIVERDGRPIDEESIAISSFGWGLPIALSGNLNQLGDWADTEKGLLSALGGKLVREDDEGNIIPLCSNDLESAYSWLLDTLGLDRALTNAPTFAIKQYQYFRNYDPPESVLLNSFFLDDLSKVADLAKQGRLTNNLSLFLGEQPPKSRQNLMRDTQAVKHALEPSKFPKGAWPSSGRFPLVTLQQCAVNLVSNDLKNEGILAVNGPPGTGKTTLLRDVIASIVTERAHVMASYRNPEDAFIHSGQKVKKGQAFVHLYKLDKKLRGFEIVLASSNNRAVENVSAELPALDAISGDANELRYFKTVSDKLLDRDTWGAIAAVLGNAGNRANFRKNFWWDDDCGLHNYLKYAAGSPKLIYEGQGEDRTERLPLVVEREKPPENHAAALKVWNKARRRFSELEKNVESSIAAYQQAYQLAEDVTDESSELRKLADFFEQLSVKKIRLKDAFDSSGAIYAKGEQALTSANSKLAEHQKIRPNIFKRVFVRKDYKFWKENLKSLEDNQNKVSDTFDTVCNNRDTIAKECKKTKALLTNLKLDIDNKRQVVEGKKREHSDLLREIGGCPVDDTFFELSKKDRETASPWFDAKLSRLRQDLFQEAMAVHKAFIDAAAKPMRHNLNILMDGFGTKSLGSAKKDALIPDMWTTLFLVVPAVSTTFASMSRMFSRIDPDELGWLLIDEAGQALPQAAVGAIMRTKRAVVVGDPIQIEPVVVLPELLTEAICKQFGIDPLIYNAPKASAQTLADNATSYFGTFEAQFGTREVGVPLLVHRRCANPMFSISNQTAYEDQMVQAKTPKLSPIKDALGAPHWIDVKGEGQDKWCPQEGIEALNLLKKMRQNNCEPDIYIITPFVIVQNRMRELLRRENIMDGWVQKPHRWINEHIGTVHTVQGREAEAVIVILGAPRADQKGARGWAGSRPNLLNVAVTRAKETIYIIGNRDLWKDVGHFKNLHAYMN